MSRLNESRDIAWIIVAAFGLIAAGVVSPKQATGEASRTTDDLWTRTKRVFAQNEPHRARYPGIAKTAAGQIVVLYTKVTTEQEAAGRGQIMVIRSNDEGQTWSKAQVVYTSQTGQPRAVGSLTQLRSGQLCATVTEMDREQRPVSVRLITSKDGESWHTGSPISFPGLSEGAWLCPHGQLIETSTGDLLMTGYGPGLPGATKGKMSAVLVRSENGGRSWDTPTIIAARENTDYTHTAAVQLDDGSLLAVYGAGNEIFRSSSEDGGDTWSSPELTLAGREPHLLQIDGNAIACVGSHGGPLEGRSWGHSWIAFSYNDGESWRCDRKVIEHPGEPGGHLGWPSGLALDAENVMVPYGHTQRPVRSQDGPHIPGPASAESERIEIAFFHREEPFHHIFIMAHHR